MPVTSPQTIRLKCLRRHDEARASAALYPGHLVELLSTGKVRKHAQSGGFAERMFVTEDSLQGRTIDSQYDPDDVVSFVHGMNGDVVYARVAANAIPVLTGDKLVSNGDGTLRSVGPLDPGLLYRAVGPSTAVSNGVATEQDFDLTYTVPASALRVGDVLRIRGHAVVSAQASTDTLTIKVYIGTQVLITTAAVDSAVGDTVYFDITVVIRTIGVGGTMVASILHTNGVPGTATLKHAALASTVIDTTTAKIVKASATWSATSATNTVALQSLDVSLQRSGGGVIIAVAQEALDNSANASEAFLRARVAA